MRYGHWIALTIAFIGGMIAGHNLATPTPQPALIHAPAGTAHATASITAVPATQADGVLYTLAIRTSCAPTRPGAIPYSELEGCILAYLNALQSGDSYTEARVSNDRAWAAIWSAAAKVCPYIKTAPPQTILPVELEACLDRLVPPPSNREGQTPTVSPQPYVLHPDKTPLSDPTQADYYRKLLEQGRFPTSGAAEGRPR